MSSEPTVHYVLRSGGDVPTREFDTLDEACDAVVLQFPVGVDFTIVRVVGSRDEQVVLQATKSTTRDLHRAS